MRNKTELKKMSLTSLKAELEECLKDQLGMEELRVKAENDYTGAVDEDSKKSARDLLTKREKAISDLEKYQGLIDEVIEVIEEKIANQPDTEELKAFIKKYDVYHLVNDNNWVIREEGATDRTALKKQSLLDWSIGVLGQNQLHSMPNFIAFQQELHKQARDKTTGYTGGLEDTRQALSIYDLRHYKEVKNLMGTLDPDNPGYYHPLYTILFKSLAGGDAKIEKYWHQFIIRKFIDPTLHLDPVPCISSNGSIGASLFGQQFLPGMFGESTVFTGGMSNLTGHFSGHLRGMLWVTIEESAHDKFDEDAVKRLLGANRKSFEAKYKDAVMVDNILSVVISTNDANGAVRVTGTESDRRYMVYDTPAENNIYAIALQIVGEKAIRAELGPDWSSLSAKDATKQWITKNDQVFRDKSQMAAFAMHLLTNNPDCLDYLVLPPVITDQYLDQVENNRSSFLKLCDMILLDKNFEGIKLTSLVSIYQKYHHTLLGDSKFLLRKGHAQILKKEVKYSSFVEICKSPDNSFWVLPSGDKKNWNARLDTKQNYLTGGGELLESILDGTYGCTIDPKTATVIDRVKQKLFEELA